MPPRRSGQIPLDVGPSVADVRDGASNSGDEESSQSTSDVRDLRAQVVLLEERLAHVREEFAKAFEGLVAENITLRNDMALLKRAMASEQRVSPGPGAKIPEPKPFGGARNAKELEIFLWILEGYFRVAGVPEGEKVTVAYFYLAGDAKLWWRARVADDADAGRKKIESWDRLKKELKVQFLPGNARWLARESLGRLTQSGTVRDYVSPLTLV